MKSLKIENFERGFAICADREKNFFAIEVKELPQTAKKGDIIIIDDDGKITLKSKAKG